MACFRVLKQQRFVRTAFAYTLAALSNIVHDCKQKSKSISCLECNQMKMSNRICLIFLRNDCIAPFQMQQRVLRTVISHQSVCALCLYNMQADSSGLHQRRNVTDFSRLSRKNTSSFTSTL